MNPFTFSYIFLVLDSGRCGRFWRHLPGLALAVCPAPLSSGGCAESQEGATAGSGLQCLRSSVKGVGWRERSQ